MENPNTLIKWLLGLCCISQVAWPLIAWSLAHRLKVRLAKQDATLEHEKVTEKNVTRHTYWLKLVQHHPALIDEEEAEA